MNIYYTAKDIEEMAGRGIRQVEIGPGVTLTDFARETANQLGITLITPGQSQPAPQARPSQAAASPASRTSKYNKPSGCMHGSNSLPVAPSQGTAPSSPAVDDSSGTVNRLIDLMGKAINRG